MHSYMGPAVLVIEGSDQNVEVAATLSAGISPGSPIPRWRGQLLPRDSGALWPAQMAGWATLIVSNTCGDLRIVEYNESGSCMVEGIGPPPAFIDLRDRPD